jgi:hypothetical protein
MIKFWVCQMHLMKSNFFEILVGLLNSLFTEHADSDFVEFFYTSNILLGVVYKPGRD